MKAVKSLIAVLLLTGIVSAASVHLKKREVFSGSRNPATIDDPGPRWMAGRSHLMLQFRRPLNEDIVQNLNERGAFVVGVLPDAGVTVSAPDGFSLEGLDVAWAGRLDINDKISAAVENSVGVMEGSFLVEFFPDVNMREARRLVEAAGFEVHGHRDLMRTHLLVSGPRARLTGLAQWDEVAYIFPASRALIRGERVHQCAGALTTGGTVPMYATAGSGWPKDASGQVTLSYVFGAMTPKLEASQATQELLRALNAWTQYAPLKFIAGTSATGSRTVYIRFATREHGDGFPFDGPGGILAHTFYPAPPNPESIAGDMHLDGDEDWHIGANTDLYTVALHEAGHALGLAHVDDPGSVMYPYYHLGSRIAPGDIAGIQSIYGLPSGSPSPVTSTASLKLSIATPTANSPTTASTIVVAGTTSGGVGPIAVTWQTDHGASGTATGTSSWSATAVPLVLGGNNITVMAADASSKAVQTVSVTRNALPPGPSTNTDRTAPSISITSPAGNVITTSAGTVDLRGSASDNVAVTRVTWQAVGSSGTATGTMNWTAAAIPLFVGDNSIVVRAYDAAGNSSWKSLLVIRH